jgi:hypothetical protein
MTAFGEWFVLGFLVLVVVIAVVATRRGGAVEPSRAQAHPPGPRTPEDLEDESATQMELAFVLHDNDKRVCADTIVFTAEQQEKSYDVGSQAYVFSYRFGRPTCALSIKGANWEAAVVMPPYRTAEEEEIALGLSARLTYSRKPLSLGSAARGTS